MIAWRSCSEGKKKWETSIAMHGRLRLGAKEKIQGGTTGRKPPSPTSSECSVMPYPLGQKTGAQDAGIPEVNDG